MKYKLYRLFYFVIHYVQLVAAWGILHTVKRDLLSKNIWLIREKRDEARDNGYFFYKYIKETHPEINAFYVIDSRSIDKYKVEKYGSLIDADGFKHCIYFLAAKFSISSQQYGAYPFHFWTKELNLIQKLCNKKQKVVFLQHGIIQNQFPLKDLSYNSCNIDYFVTSTHKEYQFIKETYQYPDNAIGCLGLARFDNLHNPHITENTILVMPTWRKWLDIVGNQNTANKMDNFCNSDYFNSYMKILTDEELINNLRAHNYKLTFYMHYKLQPYVDAFTSIQNDVIIIADKTKYDVQNLLMTSKLMVTDYSSVHFDFAYMNKPVVYYQFDKQQFHKSHYEEGFFSYEKDGFGPCFEEWHNMKTYILSMLQSGCQQQKEYNVRVKDFFDIRDNHNCERIYNALKELE